MNLHELVKYWQPLLELQSIRIEADTEPIELSIRHLVSAG